MATSTVYSVDQVVGYSLYAKRRMNLYWLPDDTSEVVRIINAGERVGNVYSYIGRSGNIWWQIGNGIRVDGYVLHQSGSFDIDALRDQGLLSTAEILEAQKAQELLDANPFTLNQLLGGGDALAKLTGLGSNIAKGAITVLKYVAIILVSYALIRYVLPIVSVLYKNRKHQISNG